MEYLAKHDTKAVAWVSPRIEKEDINMVNGLNAVAKRSLRFYAMRVQLVLSDQAPVTVCFEVMSGPRSAAEANKKRMRTIGQFLADCHRPALECFYREVFAAAEQQGLTPRTGGSGFSVRVGPKGTGPSLMRGFPAGQCHLILDNSLPHKKRDELRRELAWLGIDGETRRGWFRLPIAGTIRPETVEACRLVFNYYSEPHPAALSSSSGAPRSVAPGRGNSE